VFIEKCYIKGCQDPVCTYIDIDGGHTITCLIHAHPDYSQTMGDEKMTRAAYHYMYLSQELKEEIRDLKSQLCMCPN
jgi:acetylornithine/succinyldiaminopimelate/putrescine aminotransferase